MAQEKSSSGNVTDIAKAREARTAKKRTTPNSAEHGNRRFDTEKVERIKAEIAAGQYLIDPSRIADKFIEHERNQ